MKIDDQSTGQPFCHKCRKYHAPRRVCIREEDDFEPLPDVHDMSLMQLLFWLGIVTLGFVLFMRI